MFPAKSKLIFLRLALGVEMVVASVLVSLSHDWSYIFTNQHHLVIWSMVMALGGLWLFTSSLVAFYDSDWFYQGRTKDFRASIFFTRYAMVEFFYCGAVWGGIWWESLVNPKHHFMDVLAPVNVSFLLYLAFRDACWKRERVAVQNAQSQAKIPANVINLPVAHDVRLRTERLRG